MNKIKVCQNMCGGCPFSSKSMKGFLADYSIDDIRYFLNHSVFFTCHKHMDVNLPQSEIKREVIKRQLPLCRGFMECMVKSCITPRDLDLAKARNSIKSDLSPDSMSIFEFDEHHK